MEEKEADQGVENAVTKLTVPILLDGEIGGADDEGMRGLHEVESVVEDTTERKITNRESSLTESSQLKGQTCTDSKSVLEDEARKVLEDEACNLQVEEGSNDIFPGLDPWVPDTRTVADVYPEPEPELDIDGYDSWLSDFDALDDNDDDDDDLDLQLGAHLVTVHIGFIADGRLFFVEVTMPQVVFLVLVSVFLSGLWLCSVMDSSI